MGVVRGAIWNRHNLQHDQEIEPRPADAKVRRERPRSIIDSYLFFRHQITRLMNFRLGGTTGKRFILEEFSLILPSNL